MVTLKLSYNLSFVSETSVSSQLSLRVTAWKDLLFPGSIDKDIGGIHSLTTRSFVPVLLEIKLSFD